MWKVISKHPEYEISEDGEVRRISTKKTIKPYSVDGHLKVKLSNETEYVSRLVAETFLRKRKSRHEVKHNNGIKEDNRASNLSWANHEEIQKDLYYSGKHPKGGAEPPKEVRVIETNVAYRSIKFCAKELGVSPSIVRKCLKNGEKTVRGFHLEYLKKG